MLAQLPKAAEEVRAERRTKRLEKRKEREAAKRRHRKGKSSARQDASDSESETDESDEEREAEQEVAMGRYKWDRSAVSGDLASVSSPTDPSLALRPPSRLLFDSPSGLVLLLNLLLSPQNDNQHAVIT